MKKNYMSRMASTGTPANNAAITTVEEKPYFTYTPEYVASATARFQERQEEKRLITVDKVNRIRALPTKAERLPFIKELRLDEKYTYVTEIVKDEKNSLPEPTILNEESKFVVVTYWWGRGNTNKNLAIPCPSDYEDLAKLATDEYADSVPEPEAPEEFIDRFIETNESFKRGLENYFAKKDRFYSVDRSADPLVKPNTITRAILPAVKAIVKDVFLAAHAQGLLLPKRALEVRRRALQGKHDDIRKQKKEIAEKESKLRIALVFAEKKTVDRERTIAELELKITELKPAKDAIKAEELKLAAEAKQLTQEKKDAEIGKKFMEVFKNKRGTAPPYLSLLEDLLLYKEPVTFERMIHEQWIPKCKEMKVNYLAMEYDELAITGMYQVAINAKPMFIKKALDACKPRTVLYIDGDMFINRYPHIFDIEDVDFMARGWNIDPRASPKYEREILVDPYRFETSGGIMYYSQSPEARMLLDKWQENSHSEKQQGRADDRILSFLFNSLRLLAPMKIIQLPIEYLWLTIAYEDRKYNPTTEAFNIPIMNPVNYSQATIFVEHPACLTSEDTAGGAGAAEEREAKGSAAFEDTEYPRAELLMESVMFPSQEIANEFRPWLTYINRARYFQNVVKMDSDYINYEAMELDEGNNLPKFPLTGPLPETVTQRPSTHVTNWSKVIGKHPFIVYPWGMYGTPIRHYIYTKNRDDVARTRDLFPTAPEGATVELDEETFLIPHILKQLSMNRNIMYIPSTSSPEYTEGIKFAQEINNHRLEFIFYDRSHYTVRQMEVLKYQYKIDLRKPIYISGTSVNGKPNPILEKMFMLIKNSIRTKRVKDPETKEFVEMEVYKAELMNVFAEGYQFLSRIRAFEATPRKLSEATGDSNSFSPASLVASIQSNRDGVTTSPTTANHNGGHRISKTRKHKSKTYRKQSTRSRRL